MLTAAIVSTFGALVSLTPVGAAIPPPAPVGVNALPNPGLASCYTATSTGSNTPSFGPGAGTESLTVSNYSSGSGRLDHHFGQRHVLADGHTW
jgi:hypothetical protein